MLRYYSYYSVGGYKDFILGTNEDRQEATYYLPLLPVLEERAKTDVDAAKQVEELKDLPKIQQLSADDTYNLPKSARKLFSHAGYKIIYKHLEGDNYALALRNISGKAKDEHGRVIPFMFVILGDSKNDLNVLDLLATYFACNIKGVENVLSKFLFMDIDTNGLKFELNKFNMWVKDIVANNPSSILPTMKGGLHVRAKDNNVALLVLPEGISEQKAITEQNLETMELTSIKEIEILSKEEPERLIKQILSITEELKEERKKNDVIKKGMIAAGAAGLLVGALIASCCHK